MIWREIEEFHCARWLRENEFQRAIWEFCDVGIPPDPNIAEIPGDWRAENRFPAANVRNETLYLSRQIICFAIQCRPRPRRN